MAQLIYPKIVATILSEGGNISTQDRKILLVGPIDLTPITGGTGIPLKLYENITLEEAYLYFGNRSMLSSAIRTIYKDIYTQTSGSSAKPQIDAIGVGEGAGATGAIASISFTVSTPVNGEINFYIGSKLRHAYKLPVYSTDSASDIATRLNTLITNDLYAPFVSNVTNLGATYAVNLECVHKGVIGNNITLIKDGDVDGVTVLVGGFGSGTVNPVTTAIFDNAQNIRYQTVVTPQEWGRKYVNDFLLPRFNTNQNSIMDGESVMTVTDTFANMKSFAISGNSVSNSQVLITIPNTKVNLTNYTGAAIAEFNLVISAQFAAIRELRLTSSANISNFITTNLIGTSDSIGGPAIASLPYFNTRGFSLPIIDPEHELTNEEIDEAEESCLTVIGNSPNRQYIQLGEAVTSYRFDSLLAPDNTLKYLNYVDTFSVIREIFRNTLLFVYGQARLVNPGGSSGAGRSIASEQTIRADLISIYSTLAGSDYLLTQGDQNSIDEFKNSISIVKDSSNRGFNITMFVPIVGQLEKLNITFIFNTNT